MATKKSVDANASKAMAQLIKEVGKQVEADDRSAVARLCTAVLLRASNATAVKKALTAIEARFCDWNDLRISEKRDVMATLISAGIENAWIVTEDVCRVLSDIYQQYNVTNFDFGKLSADVFARPAPIEGEEVDIPTIRDEGLPQHETITGFLDGDRLLRETSLLDPMLIDKKNDERVLMSVYDNPTRVTAKIVWAVALAIGVLDADLLPFEALPSLRNLFGADQIAFVSHALMYYERNSRAVDKFFKMQREPEDLTINIAPFSVQLGITHEDDHQGGFEPLMPRSEGIGRVSKRAKPKFVVARATGRRKTEKTEVPASSEAAATAPVQAAVAAAPDNKATAKPAKKASKRDAKKIVSEPAADAAAAKTTTKVAKKATKKASKKATAKPAGAAKKTTKKVAPKATSKPASKAVSKASPKAAKGTVKKTVKKAAPKAAKKVAKKSTKKAAKKPAN